MRFDTDLRTSGYASVGTLHVAPGTMYASHIDVRVSRDGTTLALPEGTDRGHWFLTLRSVLENGTIIDTSARSWGFVWVLFPDSSVDRPAGGHAVQRVRGRPSLSRMEVAHRRHVDAVSALHRSPPLHDVGLKVARAAATRVGRMSMPDGVIVQYGLYIAGMLGWGAIVALGAGLDVNAVFHTAEGLATLGAVLGVARLLAAPVARALPVRHRGRLVVI